MLLEAASVVTVSCSRDDATLVTATSTKAQTSVLPIYALLTYTK